MCIHFFYSVNGVYQNSQTNGIKAMPLAAVVLAVLCCRPTNILILTFPSFSHGVSLGLNGLSSV